VYEPRSPGFQSEAVVVVYREQGDVSHGEQRLQGGVQLVQVNLVAPPPIGSAVARLRYVEKMRKMVRLNWATCKENKQKNTVLVYRSLLERW